MKYGVIFLFQSTAADASMTWPRCLQSDLWPSEARRGMLGKNLVMFMFPAVTKASVRQCLSIKFQDRGLAGPPFRFEASAICGKIQIIDG